MADSVSRAFLEARIDDGLQEDNKTIQFGATVDVAQEIQQRKALRAALGLDENTEERVVSLQEVLIAFSGLYRKEGRNPEPSLFKSLYADSQKTERTITWRSFLNTVFKQRRDLKNRISSCYNELKQIENNVDHCEKQLKNIVSSTGGTSHVRFLSQLEEERLIVQVLCIEFASSGTVDLLAETENLYKITLNCNGQFSSSASRPRLENQVFFNEMHAFSLPKAEGIVELTLHSTLPASLGEETSEPIGNGVLSLGPLSDQLKHRMTVDFSGTHVEGTVVATLQWIKSKVSFYERHIHHYAIQRNAIFRDLQELQSKLDFLELSIFGNSARKQAMKKSNPFALVSTAIKQPDLIYSWAVNKVLVSVNASNFEKATQVVVGIALLFNCLTSFTRVLFLDSLAEGFTFWCNLEPSKRWNRSKYNKVTFCLLGSIAFDTVWLYYNVRIYRSPDSDLSHLTTVLSILNILVKFLLIVFLCHSRSRSHT